MKKQETEDSGLKLDTEGSLLVLFDLPQDDGLQSTPSYTLLIQGGRLIRSLIEKPSTTYVPYVEENFPKHKYKLTIRFPSGSVKIGMNS